MKKIKKNDLKIIMIIILLLISIFLIVYGVNFAIKNYNRDDIMTLKNFDAKHTINSNQLDNISMPTPNLKIIYSELPKTSNTIENIDLKTVKKLFQTDKKSILILVKDDCTYCDDLLKNFEEVLKNSNLNAYKINVDELTVNQLNELYNYINFDEAPTTYIINNANVKHSLSGTADKETINAFIDYFYIRNN